MFEIRDVDLAGRIGRIYTRHGVVETPAFFPVIDVYRQEVGVDEVRAAGFGQVITNAYLLWKRFGWEAAEKGVHRILGFPGVVMTDSGAYQILEYGGVELSQGEVVEYQKRLGSDIAVILDIPTGDVGRREAEESVRETIRRALEARAMIEGDERIWVYPVQGGRYFDLVEESARMGSRLGFYRMYGIGSPTVFLERYMYHVVVEAVYRAKKHLPWGRPVHLFGAGHPLIFPYAVALGVDTFDSASYILYAREGRYITEYGVYRIEDLDYLPCSCPVCSRYTPQELREMDRVERTRLLALHNLYVISASMRRVKQAIREGRLWELLEETSRKHPSTARVMARMRRYADALEKGSARGRGVVRGVRAYGLESLGNPRLSRFSSDAARLVEAMAAKWGGGKAVFKPLDPKPEPGQCESMVGGGEWILFYQPFLGVFPVEACGAYPSLQIDYPQEGLPAEVIGDLASKIASTASILRGRGFTVRLEYCGKVEWQARAVEALKAVAEDLPAVEACG
ncbi:tRNA-guanine(15) transglycosylase [Aeropyrum pernix]|uniref:tRNA-guanine(15) transglycosylase n=1 Tax=Aeropyrum pernix TaxID=56636 RepID=A0A401H7R7_AERPX|nr:tRNA guanosine(15) transglycosylase TgtA [Aeropyrum pernix]GBF08454.1 tRNA-guanine(15) transglycosylase [Aeropyrum pernix]